MAASTVTRRLVEAAATLRDDVDRLRFGSPVTHVYNPLRYAWTAHAEYLSRYGDPPKKVLFLGMNPGPFGMAQTGVPFGEVNAVRDWLGISTPVDKPLNEHPARPVDGFQTTRSEVSGRRLWGLFAEKFPRADTFFADHFVVNYCPLAFLEESGRNRTPDKLPASELAPLTETCDRHLRSVVQILKPRYLIGVGGFATKRFQALFAAEDYEIGTILHPSPASPAANRGWDKVVTRQLTELGVW